MSGISGVSVANVVVSQVSGGDQLQYTVDTGVAGVAGVSPGNLIRTSSGAAQIVRYKEITLKQIINK